MNENIGVNQRASEYETTTRDKRTVFKHRAIWEDHNGKIPEDMMIHHVNGNKKDNNIENLQCVSRSEHGKHHWKEKRIRIKYPSGAVKVIKQE